MKLLPLFAGLFLYAAFTIWICADRNRFSYLWVRITWRVATVAVLFGCLSSARADELRPVRVSLVLDQSVSARLHNPQFADDYLRFTVGLASQTFERDALVKLQLAYLDFDRIISDASSPVQLAGELSVYRQMHTQHRKADVTILLTERNLIEGPLRAQGYAQPGPLCSYRAVAVVQLDYGATDPEVIAHEIAHVLGAEHDGTGQCAERSPPFGFLMAAGKIGGMELSSCSKWQIAQSLELYHHTCTR